jgi:hypothetical protein
MQSTWKTKGKYGTLAAAFWFMKRRAKEKKEEIFAIKANFIVFNHICTNEFQIQAWL